MVRRVPPVISVYSDQKADLNQQPGRPEGTDGRSPRGPTDTLRRDHGPNRVRGHCPERGRTIARIRPRRSVARGGRRQADGVVGVPVIASIEPRVLAEALAWMTAHWWIIALIIAIPSAAGRSSAFGSQWIGELPD